MASDGWDRVLLIAHLSGDLTQNAYLSPAIRVAAAHSRVRLCVILVSKQFDGSIPPPGARTEPAISHAGRWDDVQRLLTFTYVQATAIAHEKGRVLLEVDVLLRGTDAPMLEDLGNFDVLFRIQGDVLPIELPTRFEYLTSVAISASEETSTTTPDPIINNEVPSLYPVAALGGTFDHLHAGHKILLAMAAWIARDKLIIGLTDDTLLKNKSNKHVLESFTTRKERVRAFLKLFRPGLLLDLVSISDVAGPTGWDANIQALVVSRETINGGTAIDKIRVEKQLPPLKTFVIDVISATEAQIDEGAMDTAALRQAKMSSTFIRQWIAERGIV